MNASAQLVYIAGASGLTAGFVAKQILNKIVIIKIKILNEEAA
jgi:hypothetical protein